MALYPESLTDADRSRLLDDDLHLVADRLDKAVAAIDAKIAGFRVSKNQIGPRRAAELLALAKAGKLFVASLPNDEQDAIDNTPGLWGRIWEAFDS